MSELEIYAKSIAAIERFFHGSDIRPLFLQGGCYWLADYLHSKMINSYIMFNKDKEHCAIEFNYKLYDITGQINSKNYVCATERQISYMKKHYQPEFDGKKLSLYLNQALT